MLQAALWNRASCLHAREKAKEALWQCCAAYRRLNASFARVAQSSGGSGRVSDAHTLANALATAKRYTDPETGHVCRRQIVEPLPRVSLGMLRSQRETDERRSQIARGAERRRQRAKGAARRTALSAKEVTRAHHRLLLNLDMYLTQLDRHAPARLWTHEVCY